MSKGEFKVGNKYVVTLAQHLLEGKTVNVLRLCGDVATVTRSRRTKRGWFGGTYRICTYNLRPVREKKKTVKKDKLKVGKAYKVVSSKHRLYGQAVVITSFTTRGDAALCATKDGSLTYIQIRLLGPTPVYTHSEPCNLRPIEEKKTMFTDKFIVGNKYVVTLATHPLEGKAVTIESLAGLVATVSTGLFEKSYDIDLMFLRPTEEEEKTLKKTKVEKYSFTVGTLHSIDGPGIKEDLSYASPLALVTINKHMFVVIHDSVCAKLGLCKDSTKYLLDFADILSEETYPDLYLIRGMKDVGKLQRLINKIKTLPYRRGIQESGTVTVQKINL
jgi:hypothetical protein